MAPAVRGWGAIEGAGATGAAGALKRHRRLAKLETKLVRIPFLVRLTGLAAGTDQSRHGL